jgi:hypothetical protein
VQHRVDGVQLLETATPHGISFDPGRIFLPDNASSCFSYASARDLDEGARPLARALEGYRREFARSALASSSHVSALNATPTVASITRSARKRGS